MKKYKAIYIVVAFAIFWVSFASIIQFHISKIHGKDLTATIEFVKSADQHSLLKNKKIIHHSDLNPGILSENQHESTSLFNYLQKSLVQLKSECISHLCIKEHSLRGPPTI